MSNSIKQGCKKINNQEFDIISSLGEGSESELIERAKRDPEAFGEMYELYYSRILNYIYRRVMDIETAEDLTSKTFFNVLHALPNYSHRSSFRAWLYSIAINEMKMYWRSSKNQREHERDFQIKNEIEHVYFISPEIEAEEENAEKMKLFVSLQKSLDSLPEKYRAVLTLRYFENLKYDEIAQILGKRVGTVKSLVHRGLKRLRTIMEEQNATFS